MTRSARPRPLRATAAALFIAAASVTTVACGSDVVDDGVERDVREGVEDIEKQVDENPDGDGGSG